MWAHICNDKEHRRSQVESFDQPLERADPTSPRTGLSSCRKADLVSEGGCLLAISSLEKGRENERTRLRDQVRLELLTGTPSVRR